MMRPHARERIPSATAAYLEAYVALELSDQETQALVDRLITITVALTDTGTRVRGDAWKFARINELSSLRDAASEFGRLTRLTKMPTAKQLLDAIAAWRKKRTYIHTLWVLLPADDHVMWTVLETPK